MMASDLQDLVTSFYETSQMLLKEVQQYELESEMGAEQWLLLLEQREEIVDGLKTALSDGRALTDEQKDLLEKSAELDRLAMGRIRECMDQVQMKITYIQKSKLTTQQYNGYGVPEAYGSFFDKKK
jgi:hypothetical protein